MQCTDMQCKAADAKSQPQAEAKAKENAHREEKALAAREAADAKKALAQAEANANEKARREEKALAAREAADANALAQANAKADDGMAPVVQRQQLERWAKPKKEEARRDDKALAAREAAELEANSSTTAATGSEILDHFKVFEEDGNDFISTTELRHTGPLRN